MILRGGENALWLPADAPAPYLDDLTVEGGERRAPGEPLIARQSELRAARLAVQLPLDARDQFFAASSRSFCLASTRLVTSMLRRSAMSCRLSSRMLLAAGVNGSGS